jgi:hypothetical protein
MGCAHSAEKKHASQARVTDGWKHASNSRAREVSPTSPTRDHAERPPCGLATCNWYRPPADALNASCHSRREGSHPHAPAQAAIDTATTGNLSSHATCDSHGSESSAACIKLAVPLDTISTPTHAAGVVKYAPIRFIYLNPNCCGVSAASLAAQDQLHHPTTVANARPLSDHQNLPHPPPPAPSALKAPPQHASTVAAWIDSVQPAEPDDVIAFGHMLSFTCCRFAETSTLPSSVLGHQ